MIGTSTHQRRTRSPGSTRGNRRPHAQAPAAPATPVTARPVRIAGVPMSGMKKFATMTIAMSTARPAHIEVRSPASRPTDRPATTPAQLPSSIVHPVMRIQVPMTAITGLIRRPLSLSDVWPRLSTCRSSRPPARHRAS